MSDKWSHPSVWNLGQPPGVHSFVPTSRRVPQACSQDLAIDYRTLERSCATRHEIDPARLLDLDQELLLLSLSITRSTQSHQQAPGHQQGYARVSRRTEASYFAHRSAPPLSFILRRETLPRSPRLAASRPATAHKIRSPLLNE